MKKNIITLALTCIIISGYTQSKVPLNASLAIKYSGEHLSESVPVKKLETYHFIKDNVFKELKIDSLSTLENTGIDFEKAVYQYLLMEDSSMNFVTLLSIKNKQQFVQLVKKGYDAEIKPERKNGFEFAALADDKYLGWNDKEAVLMYTHYDKSKNYYSPTIDTAAVVDSATAVFDSASAAIDSIIISEETAPPPPVEKPVKKKINKNGKKGSTAAKNKKKAGKKAVPKEEIPEEPAIDDIIEEDTSLYAPPVIDYETIDSIAEAKRTQWYKEQDEYIRAKQKNISDSIINIFFNGNTTSIETDISYKKVIDPSAHINVWLNYDNFLSQVGSYFFKGLYGTTYSSLLNLGSTKTNTNLKTGINLFFDKDKIRVEQKLYSPDAEMAKLGKEIYHSKQNKSLAGYVNPDNIGYLSVSVNTEALAQYYYRMIRQYLNSTPYIGEYADLVDVYMEFMEIMIDEKAISELMPGNMMFVLHDMKTKTVTYTDFVYDDDFKQTEVKKTKQELSPNFSFIMETHKPGFMQKLVNLPLKYAEKGHYNYKEKGGYYELAFDADKYPVSSVFFMVKDEKLVITTSKEVIDLTLGNKGYTPDAVTKKSILKNNYSFNINTTRLLQQISPELTTELNRKIRKHLEENLGDVKMESRLKEGMIQTSASMNIKGQHKNSFEFLFNMVDAINNIMESDKKEKEEKVY